MYTRIDAYEQKQVYHAYSYNFKLSSPTHFLSVDIVSDASPAPRVRVVVLVIVPHSAALSEARDRGVRPANLRGLCV